MVSENQNDDVPVTPHGIHLRNEDSPIHISALLSVHEAKLQRQLDEFILRQEQLLAAFITAMSFRTHQSALMGTSIPQRPVVIGRDPSQPPTLFSQNTASLPIPSECVASAVAKDPSRQVRFSDTPDVAVVEISPEDSSIVLSTVGEAVLGTPVTCPEGPTESLHGWWRESKNIKVFAGITSLMQSKGWLNSGKIAANLKPMSKAAMSELRHQRNLFQTAVMSSYFDSFCAVMILANAALLGHQVEYMSSNSTDQLPEWNTTMQGIFLVWFTLELGLRLWAHGLRASLADWEWNLFDLLVVTISWIESVLAQTASQRQQFGIVRVIRVLRLVRIVRIFRVVRFLSDLRMMIYSSLRSFRPFVCAMSLMMLFVFMFSVHVTQAVNDYKMSFDGDHDNVNLKMMLEYYGSIYKAMWTLFQTTSGGVDWRRCATCLLDIHWSYAIWVASFVAFVVFALLNIVTGIFVNSAIQCAQEDQDVAISDAMEQENSYAQSLLRIFMEADADKNGQVDCNEFDMHLEDRRVRAYLHHLGLHVDEARGLFRLLDIGNTGRVDRKEFVLGCLRLKGPAKNVDMATLLHENKRMMELWSSFMTYVEGQFCLLSSASPARDCLPASGEGFKFAAEAKFAESSAYPQFTEPTATTTGWEHLRSMGDLQASPTVSRETQGTTLI